VLYVSCPRLSPYLLFIPHPPKRKGRIVYPSSSRPAHDSNPTVGFSPLRWRLALAGQFLLVFAVVALCGTGRIDITTA